MGQISLTCDQVIRINFICLDGEKICSSIQSAFETGESQIFADKRIFEIDLNKYDFTDESLSKVRKDFTSFYAVTDEKFSEKKINEQVDNKNQIKTKGIQVGHIF